MFFRDSKRSCSRILLICGLLLAATPGIGLAQVSADRLFVFGDSLSDPGNVYLLTGATSKAPYAPVPAAPYAIGGHHFSNGQTWAERLAQDLALPTGGKPALSNAVHFGNYAFGGARARANSGSPAPSSVAQIGLFLFNHGGVAPSDALYVLAFGGNDVRDALVTAPSDPAAAFTFISDAAGTMVAEIKGLYDSGARTFLVANAPNLGKTPAVQAAGGAMAGEFFSGLYRDMLEDGLLSIETDPLYADIEIYRLDMFVFINDIVANPQAFGIVDPFFPCLTFFVQSGAKCDDPEDHLFWDGIHPTAKGHRALAETAASALGMP